MRITEDPINREYRILFSAQDIYDVSIRLRSSSNEILFEEEFESSKAFLKAYSLADLRLGKYTWEVIYGSEVYEEEFQITSQKKSIEESFDVQMDELLTLKIDVEHYNDFPISIFLFDISGEQLDFIFWEPEKENSTKLIDLTKYDAYEVRLEIMQQGEVVVNETFSMY